jgi:hypothetical protein
MIEKMYIPKTQKEVTQFFKHLYEHGFQSHNADYNFVNSKIEHIIRQENVLGMEVGYNALDLAKREGWYNIESFDVIRNKARAFFQKFTVSDRILELLAGCHMVGVSVDRWKGITLEQARKKYGTHWDLPKDVDGKQCDCGFTIYDMRGSNKKLKVSGNFSKLEKAIELIYGKENGITYQKFDNGNIDVIGDVAKLKQWYRILYTTTYKKYNVVVS